MATRLRETLVAGGAPRTGSDLAFAQGPVMTGNTKNPNDPKVGRVLGGGRVKKESPYMLIIKDKRKSVRTAAILEKVVNERFHQSGAGEQKGACTAKTDGYLVLRVPPSYHQNQERFFRVVQLLPMVDTPALRAQRMAAWGKELLEPKTSGVAALKLEGLGPTASETLQAALKSPNDQVRFFAAEALAYLDDPVGSETLAETAIHMPKFRAYALAALASMDQNAAHMKLRNLMSEPDNELRYGAFNALRTLDPHDPSLGQVHVLDDPRTEEQQDEAPDSMALALASGARRPRTEDPFALYIVDSEGPPVVHVSRTRRSEIVVFGRSQKLLPPIVLGTGAILLNAAEKDDEIEISKIVPSKFGDSDVKLRTSLELAEVIRRVANLGTTYPEVVAILDAANRQRNLPGTLVVDAVPVSNMDYLQAAILGKDAKAKVDPAVQRAYQRSQSRFWRLFGRVIATWRQRHRPNRTRSRKPQVLPRPPLQRFRTPAAAARSKRCDGPSPKHRDGPGNDDFCQDRPGRGRCGLGHHDAECSQEGRRSSTGQRRRSDRDASPITLAGLAPSPVRRIIFLRIRSAGARKIPIVLSISGSLSRPRATASTCFRPGNLIRESSWLNFSQNDASLSLR